MSEEGQKRERDYEEEGLTAEERLFRRIDKAAGKLLDLVEVEQTSEAQKGRLFAQAVAWAKLRRTLQPSKEGSRLEEMGNGPVTLIAEQEVTEDASAAPQAPAKEPPKTVEQSLPSAPVSQNLETLRVIGEIRKILNARMAVVLAMAGSFLLTAAAMWLNTYLALGIATSFDVLIFLPVAVIAYLIPKG